MMLLLAASLFAGLLGFARPVWGLAIFLLSYSGAVGSFEQIGVMGLPLGPFRPGNMAYLAAVASLLFRKHDLAPSSRRLDALYALLWAFTITIFISETVEIGSLYRSFKTATYCVLWAPLFVGLQRLNKSDQAKLRKIIILISTLTAFLTVLIVLSGSSHLYRILSIDRFRDPRAPAAFVEARVTLPGLWSVTPLGLWFCLQELLVGQRHRRAASVLYCAAAAMMLSAMALNLSRGWVVTLSVGLVTVLFLSALLLPRKQRIRLVVGFTVVVLAAFASWMLVEHSVGTLGQLWMARFANLRQDASLLSKWDSSRNVWYLLQREDLLLGQVPSKTYRNVGGDPYTLLKLWWDWGIFVALFFGLLMLVVFVRLARVLVSAKRHSQETVVAAIWLMAYYLQIQGAFLGGLYLGFPDSAFVMTFFLAQVAWLTGSQDRPVESSRSKRSYRFARCARLRTRRIRTPE